MQAVADAFGSDGNGYEVLMLTPRLELIPHPPEASRALIAGESQYEQVFGYAPCEGLRDLMASPDISPAYLAELERATEFDPWKHGFAIVHRDTRTIIGMASFKGPPTEGMVEIAYGLAPLQWGKGLATEAAQALIRFAIADERVRLVRAHTLPEPNASTKVLTKCGLAFIGEVIDPEDGLVWRWEKSEFV